jgi:protein-S-isoprenylcysteine O-methyltransferase Ste14
MPLPPDAYAGLALVSGMALEWLVPLGLLPPPDLLSLLTLAGVGVAAFGLALEIAAARALTAAGTSTRPSSRPDALVTGGIFAGSRNPFYLGLLLVLAGAFIAFSLDWGLFLVPAVWAALNWLVVPIEEQRLARVFGEAYERYRATTRRWL